MEHGRQREPRLSSYSSLPKEHESECNGQRALVLLLTKISVKLPLAKFFIIHVMRLLCHSDNKQNAIIFSPFYLVDNTSRDEIQSTLEEQLFLTEQDS